MRRAARPRRRTRKGLELRARHRPDVPRRACCGDPTRLRQVLINLLSQRRQVHRATAACVLRRRAGADAGAMQLRFEVRDTGIGIAPRAAGSAVRAVRPGRQLDHAAATAAPASGSRSAAAGRADGRRASASTARPARGSTFWFTAWLDRANEAGESRRRCPGCRPARVAGGRSPEARVALGDGWMRPGGRRRAERPRRRRARAEIAAGRAYDVLLIDWQMKPSTASRPSQSCARCSVRARRRAS